VLHLADLLRYTLYETDAERVLLARELEFTADYLALERLRYPAASITHCVTGDAADALSITPLLLQPLLEQLFAALNPADTFTLDSTLHLASAGLTWELMRQTATPLPAYAAADAVQATARRLQLQYPGRHELRITEEPPSLRVVLRLVL
jgi:LytS/YehU family sensor histidine kinase